MKNFGRKGFDIRTEYPEEADWRGYSELYEAKEETPMGLGLYFEDGKFYIQLSPIVTSPKIRIEFSEAVMKYIFGCMQEILYPSKVKEKIKSDALK